MLIAAKRPFLKAYNASIAYGCVNHTIGYICMAKSHAWSEGSLTPGVHSETSDALRLRKIENIV